MPGSHPLHERLPAESTAWPGAELHLVGTGHAGGDEMTALMLDATNRFARRR